jgi:putative MATE family efflux protein
MKDDFVSNNAIQKIAIPAIFAGIAEPLISLTDLAIIGHVESNPSEVLAAVGVVGSFISAIIWILAQSKTAISTTVATNLTESKIGKAKTLFPQIVLVNFIVAILLIGITLIYRTFIFEEYNLKGTTLRYAIEYFEIRAWGIPFTLLTFSLFGVFRGLQNTFWALLISISGGVLNLILDIVLIHGIDGLIPQMHIQGAAYASIISQGFMFLLAAIFLYKRTEFRFNFIFPFHPELKETIFFSINLFIRTLALNLVIYLTNSQAAEIGTNTLATHTILINLWLFSCFFIDGYSNAANAISGKIMSFNQPSLLPKLWKKIFRFSLLAALTIIIIFALFSEPIIRLFTKNEIIIELAQQMIWILCILQFFNAFSFSLDGFGKGLGKGKELRNALLISTFLVFIPLVYILQQFEITLPLLWICFAIWLLTRGIYLRYKLRSILR